ncbi:MAG: hypothetical protein EOM12_04265 [Verrucomicrobiae bacterium]|nr:hypothetical protein [Verrucomicrobiae bacterium]
MKKFIIMTMIFLTSVIGHTVFAATKGGEFELSVGAMLQHIDMDTDDNDTMQQFQLQLSGNYFLSRFFSVGAQIRGTASQSSSDDDDDKTEQQQIFFLLRGDFYMAPSSPVVPYIGPTAGIVHSRYQRGEYDNSDSVFTAGVHGGLKIFLAERVSLNPEIDVSGYKSSEDNSDDNKMITVVTGSISLSYYF